MPSGQGPSGLWLAAGMEGAINLRDLGYLVALAEHRHFGRAALACAVSQPTLSIQIHKLEEELGALLVERGSSPLLLTDIGRQVVERARAILREEERIRALAASGGDPESGSLRIGLIPTLAAYLLPHVLAPLRQRFPRLELLLVEEKTDVLVDQLRDGRLDAAILALPLAEAALHSEPLFDEPFVLAVPATSHLARRASVALADLHGERLLLLEEGHCLREQALAVCRLAGAAEVADFRATGLETLRHMVAIGVGITLLPALAVLPPTPALAEVALVPFVAPEPNRRLALFWRNGSSRAALLLQLAPLFAGRPRAVLEKRAARALARGPLAGRSLVDAF